MTKQQLQELEEWCVFEGYKREKRYPIIREDYRWSKATKDEEGEWLYISCFLIYDYAQFSNATLGHPYGVTHYVIARGESGREYHLSHSLEWGKANLDDTEILAQEFYEFVKEK